MTDQVTLVFITDNFNLANECVYVTGEPQKADEWVRITPNSYRAEKWIYLTKLPRACDHWVYVINPDELPVEYRPKGDWRLPMQSRQT